MLYSQPSQWVPEYGGLQEQPPLSSSEAVVYGGSHVLHSVPPHSLEEHTHAPLPVIVPVPLQVP